jgi:hypothetical protein
VAQATVPTVQVGATGNEYFVVGDRLTDFFTGSMNVNTITMPRPADCKDPDSPSQDSGSKPVWPEGGLKLDGGNGHSASNPSGACDCRVAAKAPASALPSVIMIALFALLLRRQR